MLNVKYEMLFFDGGRLNFSRMKAEGRWLKIFHRVIIKKEAILSDSLL